MSDSTYSSSTTVVISTAIIVVMVLVGLITFGISSELNKARRMAGLSGYDVFDPDSLPAPAAGRLNRHQADSITDCNGVLVSATVNGTRYVRESGGGLYYAAEVNSRFEIFALSYGHLVPTRASGIDTHTFRKLKHALYHCDGLAARSGLQMAQKPAEEPPI